MKVERVWGITIWVGICLITVVVCALITCKDRDQSSSENPNLPAFTACSEDPNLFRRDECLNHLERKILANLNARSLERELFEDVVQLLGMVELAKGASPRAVVKTKPKWESEIEDE